MKKTPNAVTIHGMIAAQTLPVQPSLAIRMKRGTTPSWVGTARVTITNTRSAVLPRKRSLANAKPASVQKNTTDVAVTVETSRLFPSAFQNGTESKTRLAFSRKWPPGSSGGVCRVITSLVCEPTRNDQ